MAARPSSSSSSRGRSSSPFGHRKPPSTSYSSSSSSSSFVNGRLIPRSSPSSVSSHFYGSGMPRSSTPSRCRSDASARSRVSPVPFPSAEELMVEPAEVVSRGGDSILVTVRFRPLSEREFQRGDEIAWYADGDKIVRSEYNPATAYAFDRVFGPATLSKAVYDVAARPVVKAAMEGINGTVFAYGVTSSGKTHTMHAKIHEMKEKELDPVGNGDANSHVCKVCFESPAAAVLLPCRHFCLCKPCSHACSECPLCRSKIADRIIAFTS